MISSAGNTVSLILKGVEHLLSTSTRLLHPEKALSPIEVKVDGNTILSKLVHPWNAFAPRFSTLASSRTLGNFEQPLKALMPIVVMLSKLTLDKLLHPSKALLPIAVKLDGNSRVEKTPIPLNAFSPIADTLYVMVERDEYADVGMENVEPEDPDTPFIKTADFSLAVSTHPT